MTYFYETIYEADEQIEFVILDENRLTVANIHGEREDDAKEIVRACNAHHDLVKTLRGCAAALREAGKDFAFTNPNAARPNLYELHAERASLALAKAEAS